MNKVQERYNSVAVASKFDSAIINPRSPQDNFIPHGNWGIGYFSKILKISSGRIQIYLSLYI
jgi:hypothetical protein